jgi:hypothetical protein
LSDRAADDLLVRQIFDALGPQALAKELALRGRHR